ncbi:MAG: D-Ala-D-Ala carboxypeptidase family metallohydrolase [Pseudomonas protegens]
MTTNRWQNFSAKELRCKCGKCNSDGSEMQPEFMDRLQQLRNQYAKPMALSSGYRCRRHPEEARKAEPGEHNMGLAVDVAVRGPDALKLLQLALGLGFTRIGVSQKGNSRFLHLGLAPIGGRLPSPALWSY